MRGHEDDEAMRLTLLTAIKSALVTTSLFDSFDIGFAGW